MNENTVSVLKLILLLSALTFAVAVLIVVLLVERHRRTARDINGVRTSIDAMNEATDLEHGKMNAQIKTVARRAQFLVSDKIAEELGAERAKHEAKQGDHEI